MHIYIYTCIYTCIYITHIYVIYIYMYNMIICNTYNVSSVDLWIFVPFVDSSYSVLSEHITAAQVR